MMAPQTGTRVLYCINVFEGLFMIMTPLVQEGTCFEEHGGKLLERQRR